MSNRATFLRLLDAVNTGDPEITSKVIDEIVEPDVLFRASVPTGATGAEALKQVWGTLIRVFSDLEVTVCDLIDEGDKIVARHTVRGTRRSTGQRVTRTEIFAARFADGRIAEIWGLGAENEGHR
jgi:ketosteroid isomerase-like protein